MGANQSSVARSNQWDITCRLSFNPYRPPLLFLPVQWIRYNIFRKKKSS